MTLEEQIQTELRRLGRNIGQAGPHDDGVDGNVGPVTLGEILAVLKKMDAPRSRTRVGKADPNNPFDVAAGEFVGGEKKATRPIDAIVICSTNTNEGLPLNVDHLKAMLCGGERPSYLPWHAVVLPDGTIQRGCAEGRIGWGADNHNTGKIFVAYVGGRSATGAPKDTRTDAQRKAMLALRDAYKRRYPTIASVVGANALPAAADEDGKVPPLDLSASPSFDVESDALGKKS